MGRIGLLTGMLIETFSETFGHTPSTTVTSVFTRSPSLFISSAFHGILSPFPTDIRLRCSEVGRWEPISDYEILLDYGDELYTSSNPATRERINVDDFPPLYDLESGREIPIFTVNGIRIPRLAAIHPADGARFCALLPNIRESRSLFYRSSSHEALDEDEDDAMEVEDALDDDSNIEEIEAQLEARSARAAARRDVQFQVYPTAFTHTLGNWQAKGVITPLHRLLTGINAPIRRFVGGGPPVMPSISQAYNNFIHHTRRSAGQHIVQRGILTGVTAGAWSTNASTQATATKLFRHVEFSLPNKALEEQVKNVDNTALRFENVFTIHMARLQEDCLDGGAFFDAVIEPLIEACGHPDVFEALRGSTTVLRPGVRALRLALSSSAS